MTGVPVAPVRDPVADAPEQRRRRRSSAYSGGNPLVYAVALVVVAITVGPVLYAILGGFRTNAQLAADPVGLPDPWVLSNYVGVVTSSSFWRFALNSTIVALITTVLVTVCGVMAAYPLARYSFKGRETLFLVFVLGLLF